MPAGAAGPGATAPTLFHLWAKVAYDGGGFSGFQIQRAGPAQGGRSKDGPGTATKGVRTVQGVLEDALAQILQQPIRLTAAGRTDSGVHALGQVVALTAPWRHSLADLHRAWNAVLPADVAVLDLDQAPPGFHPRYDALGRVYRYTIWNHPVRNPLLRRAALWVSRPLDVATMDQASQLLVGTHNFATFGTPPGRRFQEKVPPASTIRRVDRITWLRGWPQGGSCDGRQARASILNMTVEANAFLYRMVRSIVGTLLQVGRGELSLAEFRAAFEAADRTRAGPTAPPEGLCLVEVRYPDLGTRRPDLCLAQSASV